MVYRMGQKRYQQWEPLVAGLLLLASLAMCQPASTNSVTVKFNTKSGKSVPIPKLADREQCYGISKAQENDGTARCDDCAGTAAKDYMPNTWKYVPRGTCEAVGGTVVAGKPWPESK